MKKCEPWTVAAAYLMQNGNEKKHYTNIVNYILETEATELIEKSAATSQAVNEVLKHKVVNGRAIFKSEGSGFYSLEDVDAAKKNEDIQTALQYLKEKDLQADQASHEDNEKNAGTQGRIQGGGNEKLSDEAKKLTEEASRLCDETMKLGDEVMKLNDETKKLSDEVTKLGDENKNLLEETEKLQQENQQLREEAEKYQEEKKQLNEKLDSIKQLC